MSDIFEEPAHQGRDHRKLLQSNTAYSKIRYRVGAKIRFYVKPYKVSGGRAQERDQVCNFSCIAASNLTPGYS
jgi:hypothetical protein